VEPGQVFGLLGPNGAGKATALRIMLGLVRPTAGEVRILGERIRPGSPVLARVGNMIEHADFVPFMTGMENLRAHWKSGSADFADADVDTALAIAGLGDAIDRKVKTYSQGMRQRLGVARAILGDPEALILDEPTNGLDPGEIREVRELLLRVATAGATVVLSSHLLAEVEQVCSHAVVIDHGRLIARGTVAELVQASSVAYLEVDDRGRAQAALEQIPGVRSVRVEGAGLEVQLDGTPRWELVDVLVAEGLKVETLTARHRLEDAFLALIHDEAS
jgi:ABC-2 type transport system ATP-binding protein